MTNKEILETNNPNVLRHRLDEIDRAAALLQAERSAVHWRFQTILSQPYRPTTNFELQPLVDAAHTVPPLRRPMGAPVDEGLWEATK